MTPVALGLVVALAAAAAVCLTLSLVTVLVWQLGRTRIEQMAAAQRAPVVALLRLLPGVATVSAAALTFNAFVRLEPVDARESVGVVLAALAVGAAVSLGRGALRAGAAWRETQRTVRAWRHEPVAGGRLQTTAGRLRTTAIDTRFPVVAVVGLWKPRLYIARQVLAACDGQELEAIAAHEAAHVRAGDNLVRLLFLCAPAVGFATGVFAALERAWMSAAEERADDCARPDAQRSLALASALTKVARLAASSPAPVLHASSILSGSTVEARVRRLCSPPPAATPARLWPAVLLVEWIIVGCAISPAGLRALYEVAELCVRHLP